MCIYHGYVRVLYSREGKLECSSGLRLRFDNVNFVAMLMLLQSRSRSHGIGLVEGCDARHGADDDDKIV